jgi:hypothetical protein
MGEAVVLSASRNQEKWHCRVSLSIGICFPDLSVKRGFDSFAPLHRPAEHTARFRAEMGVGQSGAHTAGVIIYVVAIDVDIAVIIDVGGIIAVIAGRPKPPPPSPYNQNPRKHP